MVRVAFLSSRSACGVADPNTCCIQCVLRQNEVVRHEEYDNDGRFLIDMFSEDLEMDFIEVNQDTDYFIYELKVSHSQSRCNPDLRVRDFRHYDWLVLNMR